MINISYKLNNRIIKTNKSDENIDIIIKEDNNRFSLSVVAKNDIELISATKQLSISANRASKYFLNGYQSWTDTVEASFYKIEKISKRGYLYYRKKDVSSGLKDPLNKKFAFDRYGDLFIYNYSRYRLHGYDIFYIKGKNEFFSYNLNYKNAFLIYELIKYNKKINIISNIKNYKISKGDTFKLFDYMYFNSYDEGIKSFNNYFNIENKNKIFGYTSWYNYYQNINEGIITRDLEALDNRFNLFQIDDGYETFVGDWLDIDKNKFPNGLYEIVNKIHNRGYKAGIWLAPFVAEEKSKLFQERKDLFKKDKKGNPIKCGGNWSGFYVLDILNPDAVKYIKECLEYYINLGFDFFKLDFLYSITLPNYDSYTKAMITDYGYQLLRDILKDKMILGCGAYIFSSYQKFDYLRVGPDVSLKFDDEFFMKFAHRERISTKITLQNTIYRSIFNNHLFLNDPDVFLLRDDNISLNEKQKEALLVINALFGSVLMTSDNIKIYDKIKNELLNKAFEIFNNAKDISFEKQGKNILIKYDLNNKENIIEYNTNKGGLKWIKQA
ncbi:MAG: alpha-galactosidase [Acholeplasmatales bacterium]|nr:alpha-galactosidase [Acholeplasmatales bacterium]